MNKYSEMLKSERWQETRRRINQYGNGRCEYCGERTDRTEVHHEKYEGYHPSDTSDDNLKSLCPECHYETHWIQRLRLYSKEKRRLMDAFIEITPELHKELTIRFRV